MQRRTPTGRRFRAAAIAAALVAASPALAQSVAATPKPVKPLPVQTATAAVVAPPKPAEAQAGVPVAPKPIKPVEAQPTPEFARFIEELWPEAKARGVSRQTFDQAFRGVAPDPKIVALTTKQSEFVRPIWDYVNGAVTPARLDRGLAAAQEWSAVLDGIERRYGVPRAVVLGVWGMETNFGRFTGTIDVVQALATLTFTRYRPEFFRGELLTALDIMEAEGIGRETMRGSWAGAMGQTQFMPTSYVRYAVDGDGDGRRDIWGNVPDALASTANYLRQKGWQSGQPWGFEVLLPEGFDYRHLRQGFAAWRGLGLRRLDGGSLPWFGEATLFLPGGAGGPAFLLTANFDVIKSYNASDAYALGVAHLGDRVTGGGPIQGAWPVDEPVLDREQRVEVQRRLTALGLYQGKTDGKLGAKTRDALREFQLSRDLVPDGYANLRVLGTLRSAAQ